MKKLLGVVLSLLLCACGGGGGTSGGQAEPPPVPPPVEPPALTFNMDAAYATALATGVGSDRMPETSSASGRLLVVSYQPTTDGQFLGQTYRRSLMNASMLASAGSLVPTIVSASTISYSLNPTLIAGQFDSQGNLTRYLPLGNLPTSAVVGQTGPYARALVYDGPTEQKLLSEQLVSWSVEADTATTAWACLTFTRSDGNAAEKDCLRIDSAGSVSGIKMQVPWAGATLVFQEAHLAVAQPLPYTFLDEGLMPVETAPGTEVAMDQGTWTMLWPRYKGSGPLLPIDFSRQRVAAMAFGPRPMEDCWSVAVVSVDEWPDRVSILYRETSSQGPCVAMLRYPSLLLAVPLSAKPIVWIPVSRPDAPAGAHALSARVNAAYDLPSSGACRVLRFDATWPTTTQAGASDVSELTFALLDATGATRASTWDNLQVSVEPGSYRVTGSGCPPIPAPHGTVWPLLKLKLNGIAHEFFAAPTTPVDSSALPFRMIDNRGLGALFVPQFLTMSSQAAFASFWAGYAPTAAPAVDFSQSMVAAILLPEADACHQVIVDAVVEWTDHIEVQYRNAWIPGMFCAAAVIPGGAGAVFTMPLTTKPFEWVRAP